MSAALSGPEVAVLTISHSGSRIGTVTATRLAREAGARTVVITEFGRIPIAAHAGVLLHTTARETRYRTEAMTSRIAQFAVLGALVSRIAPAPGPAAAEALRRSAETLALRRFRSLIAGDRTPGLRRRRAADRIIGRVPLAASACPAQAYG